jgi:hypothetical protein
MSRDVQSSWLFVYGKREVLQMIEKSYTQNVLAKRLYSIKELVKEIGVTEWFWRTQIWDGQLPYVQVGQKKLIDSEDVESFIKKHKLSN